MYMYTDNMIVFWPAEQSSEKEKEKEKESGEPEKSQAPEKTTGNTSNKPVDTPETAEASKGVKEKQLPCEHDSWAFYLQYVVLL